MSALDNFSKALGERRGHRPIPQLRQESGAHSWRFVLLPAGSRELERCPVPETSVAIYECSSQNEEFVGLVAVKTLLALQLKAQQSCLLGGKYRVPARVLNACQQWVKRERSRRGDLG